MTSLKFEAPLFTRLFLAHPPILLAMKARYRNWCVFINSNILVMKRAEHHIVDRRKGNAGASVVMERSELLKRLEHVEQQLWQVTELIARQRKIIAELGAMGGDTDPAQIMLQRQGN